MGMTLYFILQTNDLGFFDQVPGLSEIVNAGVFALQLSYILFTLSFGFVFAAGRYLGMPALEWFTVCKSFRYGHLAVGVGAAISAAILDFVSEWLIFGAAPEIAFAASPETIDKLLYICLVLIAFLVSASAEEVFFRSYLLRVLQHLVIFPLFAVVASAIIFSIAHLEFTPAVLAVRFIAGLALGWIAWRLGGIEFAIGAHAAGNVMLAIFTTPLAREGVSEASGFDVAVEVFTAVFLVLVAEALHRRYKASAQQEKPTERSYENKIS